MEWTRQDPKLHDQRAFCLVTRLCVNRNNRQSPVDVPLPSTTKLVTKVLNAHEVAASVRPWALPAGETFAVHVLSTRPLDSPFGKSLISREQRATPATDLWLVTDTRRHRWDTREAGAAAGSGRTRLIAVEGVLSITRSPGYHCVDCLRWQTAWLVALAFASKRTLVLPPVMFDFGYQMLAVYVDIASISQLIEWRETNFLSDPRLHRHLYLEQQQQQQRQQHKDVSTGFTSSVRLPGNWSSPTSPFPFSSVARLSVMPSKSKQWKISVSTTAAIGTTGTERGGSNSTQHSCRSRVVPGALLQEKILEMVTDVGRDADQDLDSRDIIATAREADILYISMPMTGTSPTQIMREGRKMQKEGNQEPIRLVQPVYKALRFCVKGRERGYEKGFLPGDTTVGQLCQTEKHKDA